MINFQARREREIEGPILAFRNHRYGFHILITSLKSPNPFILSVMNTISWERYKPVRHTIIRRWLAFLVLY